MKKIILSLIILLILLLPSYSYAYEGFGTKVGTNSGFENGGVSKTQTGSNELFGKRVASGSSYQENVISNLKQRADNEITRRVEALNKLLKILSESKKLSSTTSASLSSQVQSNIDGLNTLKTKIDADTDITTLRADVKSIISNYYIFAFFIDYVHLNAALDRATTTENNIIVVWTKLQTKITEAQGKGQDVASLSANLTDMQNKLNDAKSLTTAASAELSGLLATGYPANKTTLQDARTKLQAIHADLKTAYLDAKKIIHGLRIDKHEGLSKTPTPTAF